MKLYKFTDLQGRTRNETQWGPGVTHEATGNPAQGLCSDGFIHAYETLAIGIFMSPAHGYADDYLVWEAEGTIVQNDNGLRCGCRKLTTLRHIECPIVTSEQRVYFAIRCALVVYNDQKFQSWALDWISGKDRTYAAAAAAYTDAADDAATYAANAAANAAAAAADANAAATYAAADANAAAADYVNAAATYAANAAANAGAAYANAAADDADYANAADDAYSYVNVVFQRLAKEALEWKA